MILIARKTIAALVCFEKGSKHTSRVANGDVTVVL